MNENRLNPESLVEENYGLIKVFMRNHRYYGDLYYDAAVDGLLEAARRYCEYPELQKLEFSQIAFRKMKDMVYKLTRKEARRSEIVEILHLEDPMANTAFYMQSENFPDLHQNVEEDVAERLLLAQMLSALTEKQMEVFQLKRFGYTYNEMAAQCGIGYYGVSSRIHRMKNKLRGLRVTMEW